MLKKMLIAGVIAAALPLPALADPYVLIGGATGSIDLGNIKDAYGNDPTKTDDTVNRAIVGIGARVNRNLGIQASYMTRSTNNVHDNLGNRDEFDHDGFQLALLGFLPVAPNVDLFGKLSANVLNTDYSTNALGTPNPLSPTSYYSESHTNTYLGYGGGVEFNISRNASIRAEIEQIQIRDAVDSRALNGNNGDFDVTQGSLNLLVYF